jgi:acetyl-CoA acyltransferase
MNAYIVAGYRSAVAKAGKGAFKFYRPDDLAADVIKHLMASVPVLDKDRVDDVIVGNAMPEAEHGLNMGRLISLLALDTDKVPGMTVNRYCASGLETIAIASAKIHAGIADCIIAGGAESMSLIPMGGWRVIPNPTIAKEHPDWYWGMGLTAEAVAKEYNISRQDQDMFAFQSHQKAVAAIQSGKFNDEIVPVTIKENYLDENMKKKTREFTIKTDEGARADTSPEQLAKLKPVFADNGSVTAGNSSQTSDGAAFVIVMSERMVNELNLKPIARLVSHAVAGVPPRIMGIGPVEAIPLALKKANLSKNDIGLFELNEAFASQSLAVLRKLDLNQEIVNVNGGAISLGHPLGCSGAKLSVQLFNELRRRNKKYGMVTMCVGTGQGAAGIFELLN